MTASLLSLPFEVHLIIARHLNLKDALSYADVSPLTHDVIYYIFSHRLQLDFSSTLNNSRIIDLPEDTIMRVLHAHTRATEVHYLALSQSFQSVDELRFYLDLYWRRTYVPEYVDGDEGETMSWTGTHVGHPSGHLQRIGYGKPFSLEVYDLLHEYDDPMCGFSIQTEPLHLKWRLPESANWSSADIDEPYATCTTCGQAIQPPPPFATCCNSCSEDRDEPHYYS